MFGSNSLCLRFCKFVSLDTVTSILCDHPIAMPCHAMPYQDSIVVKKRDLEFLYHPSHPRRGVSETRSYRKRQWPYLLTMVSTSASHRDRLTQNSNGPIQAQYALSRCIEWEPATMCRQIVSTPTNCTGSAVTLFNMTNSTYESQDALKTVQQFLPSRLHLKDGQ